MTLFVQLSPWVNAIALLVIGPCWLMRPNQLFSMTRPVFVGSSAHLPGPFPETSIPKTAQFQMWLPAMRLLSLSQGARHVVWFCVELQSCTVLWTNSTSFELPSHFSGSLQGWLGEGVVSDQQGPQSECSITTCCTSLR